MADEKIPNLPKLPATGVPGDRVSVDGREWVFDAGAWQNAESWDVLTDDQKEKWRIYANKETSGADGSQPSGLYDPTDEQKVRAELLKMKNADRDDVLKRLYESGQYGGSKRGNGFSSADINAFADLLWYSNAKNKPFKEALREFEKDFPKSSSLLQGVGRKPPRQVTNPAEIKAVFRKTAQNMLGRSLPDNVADQFVQMIQSQEATFQQQLATQSGGTLTQPADVGLQAQQLVESQFEDQLRVQNAATFAGTMDQMIKGLAL